MIARRALLPSWTFRYACLLTAIANMGGNVLLLLFFEPVFDWLGVPQPVDLRLFILECVLSFSMGAVPLLVFLQPRGASRLLAVGIIGKSLYALITYYFWATEGLHWFYLVFVVWDAVFVVIFFLYWLALANLDLVRVQQDVFEGIDVPARASSRRALLLGFSLTQAGSKALERMARGLSAKGYTCDTVMVVPQESIFTWPLSLWAFIRICARAFVRRPARIAPLALPTPRPDWDLVVVESPTWLLGMGAPVEAVLTDPQYRELFRGRDAAVLIACRGAYQRSLGMAVRRLQDAGANVVAARGLEHPGREPKRLMSLWFYLIFRRAGVPRLLAADTYGLSEETLTEVEVLGRDLAERARTRPHWTLLLESDPPSAPSLAPNFERLEGVVMEGGRAS